ncbi:putative L-ascorbate peroxidase 6, chloroplastic [Hordeum vulgare]|nr:putative L-ascorbate peroxidase 6, chloroplastic [Hordeum vulgare]
METLMVDRVHSSLRLFMNRDAVFLCERLCPPRNTPSPPPHALRCSRLRSPRDPSLLRSADATQGKGDSDSEEEVDEIESEQGSDSEKSEAWKWIKYLIQEPVGKQSMTEGRLQPASDNFQVHLGWHDAGLVNALKLIEAIKDKYTGVTYADLFQLASATAVEEAGGPKIPMIYGGVDVSPPEQCPPEGRLPVLHDIDLYIM